MVRKWGYFLCFTVHVNSRKPECDSLKFTFFTSIVAIYRGLLYNGPDMFLFDF